MAGDIYTRIHPFGNRDLFRRLEVLGLEVWPAPFVLDIVEFCWRREMSERFDEGRYKEAAGTALLFLRKELESLRIRYQLGTGSSAPRSRGTTTSSPSPSSTWAPVPTSCSS